MKGFMGPLRTRGKVNLVLDALFLVWALYFLASGRIVPNMLLWDNQPTTQAVRPHGLDPAAPQPASPEMAPALPGVYDEDGTT